MTNIIIRDMIVPPVCLKVSPLSGCIWGTLLNVIQQWTANETSYAGGRHNMPRPCKLTFDLLTLKVVSGSCVTWATSMPILVFPGLSDLNLGPMYATGRQTSDIRRASSLNAPDPRSGGIMSESKVRNGAATDRSRTNVLSTELCEVTSSFVMWLKCFS